MKGEMDRFGLAAGYAIALVGVLVAVQLLMERPCRVGPLITALALMLLGAGMIARARGARMSLWLIALASAAVLARHLLFP